VSGSAHAMVPVAPACPSRKFTAPDGRYRVTLRLMNRRLWLIVLIFAVVSAITGRYVYRNRRAAANSAAVQAPL